MFKIFAKAGSLLLTVVVALSFLSCGDVEKVGAPRSQELGVIEAVLKEWRSGYETEDVDAYINVFWGGPGFVMSRIWEHLTTQQMM